MSQLEPNILLVEDERDLSAIVATWLRKESIAVDTAYDGLEALHKITHNRYDAIVLDYMLPKADGLEVCKRVRSIKITVPIIVVTARATAALEEEAIKSGANLFMAKPFKLSDLTDRIKQLIRRNRHLAA